MCQLKVSRHTVITDTRTEYDPAEDTRMPEQCHLLSAVTNRKSVACISVVMGTHLRGKMHNHKKNCRWEMRGWAMCTG